MGQLRQGLTDGAVTMLSLGRPAGCAVMTPRPHTLHLLMQIQSWKLRTGGGVGGVPCGLGDSGEDVPDSIRGAMPRATRGRGAAAALGRAVRGRRAGAPEGAFNSAEYSGANSVWAAALTIVCAGLFSC